jgi:trehalose-phosphatase
VTSEPISEAKQPVRRASATLSPALPRAWINARDEQARLWEGLAQAPRSLLICDYDGTLAPFKADKMTALPFPGVVERLEKIAALPRSTLALVSGRPLAELITLFPLAARLELYGSHGREYRSMDGAYRLSGASEPVRRVLDGVAAELARLGYADALERKEGSLAVHWRNLSPAEQVSLDLTARAVFSRQLGNEDNLSVLPFESGVELRANDHTKAHAVEALLASVYGGEQAVAAYLGDDTTDEDAFGALGARGLSLLVREEPRPSLAGYWLRPPAQLLGFLDDWLRAAGRSS